MLKKSVDEQPLRNPLLLEIANRLRCGNLATASDSCWPDQRSMRFPARKRHPDATHLLNCPKSGKNARIRMVEYAVVVPPDCPACLSDFYRSLWRVLWMFNVLWGSRFVGVRVKTCSFRFVFVKRLLYQSLTVLKFSQAIDPKFDIANSPVANT